ncbi:MAG: ABC transporter ATP-binding protein [Clostridia bacterium]|nr:ABC transporter ATP-binding protein [Clostridia bacterium]
MIVELKNICKDYDQGAQSLRVLHNIDLAIEKGDYAAIMGPSGSGKSTLMNILGFLDRPTEGTYLLDGVDYAEADDAALAAVRNRFIGFIFQSFHLLDHLSAWQNVALPLSFRHTPRAERREMAEQALERVGLADRMDFKPSQLSGGQKQRVAIARALCTHPALLLADEPTGALDSKSGLQILDLFDMLHQEGSTIIMITHEHGVAKRAEKMFHIIDGRIHEGLFSSGEGEELK